ncbi:hypothetical protein PQX77_021112 [Marasmius sp. AFHP31]|nr:hypothetical protein PQX77_021112 [Marasmius sp. AFHP31]
MEHTQSIPRSSEAAGREQEQKIVKCLNKLRKRGLGAKSLRTVAQAAFKKSECALQIKKSLRCYPTAVNDQKLRNLALPAANVKLTVNNTIDDPEKMDHYLQLVWELNDVVVPLTIQAYRMRLLGQYCIMRDMADLMKTPRIACSKNCLYTGSQLNITLAQLHDSMEVLKELGFFRGVHHDQFDTAANMSNMTCCSDLLEGYEGGCFHFVELGVYIKLDGIQLIGFSGLRYHSRTPPLAPQGEELDPSAYRLEDGTAYSHDVDFMYNGRLLMTAEDLFQFANRNLFLANNFVHQQQLLGADYTLDHDQFRCADILGKAKCSNGMGRAQRPSESQAYQLLCASNAHFIPAIYDKYRDIINPIRGSLSTGIVIKDEGAMDDDSDEDKHGEDKKKHQPWGDVSPVRGRPVKKGTRTKNWKGSRKSNQVDDDVPTMIRKVASKVLSDPLGERACQAKEDVGRRQKQEVVSVADLVEQELLVSSSDEQEVEAEQMDQDAQDGDAVMEWEPCSCLSPSPGIPSDHNVEMEEATSAQQPHTANEHHVPRSSKEAILGTKSNGKRAKSTKSKNKKKVTYTPSICPKALDARTSDTETTAAEVD